MESFICKTNNAEEIKHSGELSGPFKNQYEAFHLRPNLFLVIILHILCPPSMPAYTQTYNVPHTCTHIRHWNQQFHTHTHTHNPMQTHTGTIKYTGLHKTLLLFARNCVFVIHCSNFHHILSPSDHYKPISLETTNIHAAHASEKEPGERESEQWPVRHLDQD